MWMELSQHWNRTESQIIQVFSWEWDFPPPPTNSLVYDVIKIATDLGEASSLCFLFFFQNSAMLKANYKRNKHWNGVVIYKIVKHCFEIKCSPL